MVKSTASHSFGEEYVIFVNTCVGGVVAGLTNGSVNLLGYDLHAAKPLLAAGGPSLTGMGLNSEHTVSVSDADGGIRIVDTRTAKLESRIDAGMPLACLSTKGEHIAVGTELEKPDAGVLVYDLRKGTTPIVKYIDSHNDDVTDVRFHPHLDNTLLSGSTDGIVNLYNTAVADEDDAVYQTINHGSSIHRTGFLSDRRVFALSHMETLAVYQVADPDEEVEEPKPTEFGDVRETWGCQYVADFVNEYFLVGTNAESKAKLIPFYNEVPGTAIELDGAHGEEVIRTFDFHNSVLYTGGEDGLVKAWALESKSSEKHRGPKKVSSKVKKPY